MPAADEQVDCNTAAFWLMSIASADLGHVEGLGAGVAALQAREAPCRAADHRAILCNVY